MLQVHCDRRVRLLHRLVCRGNRQTGSSIRRCVFADFNLTVIGNAEPVADHVRWLGYCAGEQMSVISAFLDRIIDVNVVMGRSCCLRA
jgi:hypothetical protein